MAVLCGMNTVQYSAWNGPLSVHKLFTLCIWWCLVSRACDWVMSVLSAMLPIFSLQFSLLFFHVGHPGCTAAYLAYPISGIAENLGRFLVRSVQLILTAKISPVRDLRSTLRNWRFCQVQSHVMQKLGQI